MGRLGKAWPGVASVASVVAIWEILSLVGILEPDYIPSASDTFGELTFLAGTDVFWISVGGTLHGHSGSASRRC